jgi:hypothetical protein
VVFSLVYGTTAELLLSHQPVLSSVLSQSQPSASLLPCCHTSIRLIVLRYSCTSIKPRRADKHDNTCAPPASRASEKITLHKRGGAFNIYLWRRMRGSSEAKLRIRAAFPSRKHCEDAFKSNPRPEVCNLLEQTEAGEYTFNGSPVLWPEDIDNLQMPQPSEALKLVMRLHDVMVESGDNSLVFGNDRAKEHAKEYFWISQNYKLKQRWIQANGSAEQDTIVVVLRKLVEAMCRIPKQKENNKEPKAKTRGRHGLQQSSSASSRHAGVGGKRSRSGRGASATSSREKKKKKTTIDTPAGSS